MYINIYVSLRLFPKKKKTHSKEQAFVLKQTAWKHGIERIASRFFSPHPKSAHSIFSTPHFQLSASRTVGAGKNRRCAVLSPR